MKNQKGITLVALVITIIVLLILAGVSISLVIGNNGVLTQASSSVVTNKLADAKQALQMAQAACETSYYAAWTSDTTKTRKAVYIDEAQTSLSTELEHLGYTLTALTSLPNLSEVIITSKSTKEVFTFNYVTIDANTGVMTYGKPAQGSEPAVQGVLTMKSSASASANSVTMSL